ncbi:autotransporter domain-containing protein [Orbus mooreae]|uniref:autotransporter domain-containing protein n=1 Tax=Orbus mooreae TaxID=3074107 RepID=UPI00370D14A9
MRVIEGEKKPVGTFTPIAVIDGGINKYKSGSSVDTRDYRFIVGSQYQLSDDFLMGLTAEYGRSNFDTHNEFTSGNVDGSGHSYNYGVSLFGKLQTTLNSGSEMYMNGAIRFGRTDTEFQSGDIVMGSGESAHYKSKVNYWGAILGAGYIYHLNDISSFDTSIHYLWTRLGHDSINLDGDAVDFDNSSSSRIQLKEQYGYQHSDNIKFTLAGIYEYEMDGDANASTYGMGIDAPSVKGSTGIMEMGVVATPIEGNKDFSLNLNFRGYAGKREGASAAVIVKYDF